VCVCVTSHDHVPLQGKGEMTTFWLQRHKSQTKWETENFSLVGDAGGDASNAPNE